VRFQISPDIVTALGLLAKRPGDTMRGEEVELDFVPTRATS
jgi:hypothetical protein